MAKFHIGRGGKAAVCSARKGNCPFASDEEHFKTRDEAQKTAQKLLEKENNIVKSSTKKKEKDNSTLEKLDSPNTVKNDSFSGKLDKKGIAVANLIAAISTGDITDEQQEKAIMIMYDESSNMSVNSKYWDDIEIEGKKVICEKALGKDAIGGLDKYVDNLDTYTETIGDKKDEYKDITDEAEAIVSNIVHNDYKNRLKYLRHDLETGVSQVNFMYDMGDDTYLLSSTMTQKYTGKKIHTAYFIDAVNGLDNVSSTNVSEFFGGEEKDDVYNFPHKMGLDGISVNQRKAMSDSFDKSIIEKAYLGHKNIYNESISDVKRELYDDIIEEKRLENYDKVLHRNIAISANVFSGNTYLQKNYNLGEVKKFSNKSNSQFFQTGMTLMEENNLDYAQKVAKNKDVKEKIQNIKNANYGDSISYQKELDLAKDSLDKIDTTQRGAIFNYTTGEYKDYSAKSHGFSRADFRKVTDDNIGQLNSIVKQVEKDSVSEKRFLYRGSRVPENMSKEFFLSNYNVGDTVVTNKLTSTTSSGEVMSKFSNSEKNFRDNNEEVNFVYYTRKGAHVSSISRYDFEKETIIGIGEKMTVIDKGYDKEGVAYVVFADSEK